MANFLSHSTRYILHALAQLVVFPRLTPDTGCVFPAFGVDCMFLAKCRALICYAYEFVCYYQNEPVVNILDSQSTENGSFTSSGVL